MSTPDSTTQPPSLRLRVFLASPGGVGDERALSLRVLEQLPYDPFLRGRISLADNCREMLGKNDFGRAQEAYEVLKDAHRRKVYDRKRA